jgi:hypothetical protein
LISTHPTAAEAFAAIDRLASEMMRSGAPSDAVELIVIDSGGQIVARPGAHNAVRHSLKRRQPVAYLRTDMRSTADAAQPFVAHQCFRKRTPRLPPLFCYCDLPMPVIDLIKQ